MESYAWSALGDFVTSANRGGGRVYSFLADDATPVATADAAGGAFAARGDLEEQATVRLTHEALVRAAMGNRFGEVKWAATIALALLRAHGGRTEEAPAV